MKVFIDTNIIISAMLFPDGIVSKVYFKCISKYECYISKKVIDELKDVFNRKFKNKLPMLDIFITMILKSCKYVEDSSDYNVIEDNIRDVKDRIIYRTAKEAGCDAILTGDKDFIEAKNLDIKILQPSEFEEE